MTNDVATSEAKPQQLTEMQEMRGTIDRMGDQFLAALPSHVSVDKFKRTVITAITMQPDLLKKDRRTLLAACMKAASDGLLLDNRDAALVSFGNDVQYMPMVGGVLKRMRQSGDIKAVTTDVVCAGDQFDYWTDENGKHLTHRPAVAGRGDITHAYAIVNTKDGGIYIEVMDVEQITKVRNVSRAKNNGPWVQWFDQMARKTVLRRLAKTAPMSSDVADMLQRDDEPHVDFSQAEPERPALPARTRPAVLDAIAHTAADTPPPSEAHSDAPTQAVDDAGGF